MRFVVLAMILGVFPMGAKSASHRPQDFLEAVKGRPDEGIKIVEHFCSVCHAENPQIPLGAPSQKIDADWQERVKKGLAVLLENTAEGYHAMPARGGCFECSDEQLTKAILELIPKAFHNQLQSVVKEHK